MVLAAVPAKRALAGSAGLGLGGFGAPRRGAYEWGVRSTRKPEPPLDRVYEIPGLEPITYAGKMHFMPGLARPVFPPWDRGWNHPRFHRSPPIEEHSLYKDQTCYIFHQRCRLLEGEAPGQAGGDLFLCLALILTLCGFGQVLETLWVLVSPSAKCAHSDIHLLRVVRIPWDVKSCIYVRE